MRYNIKRLFREHEEYKRQLAALLEGHTVLDGRTSEINRLRHAASLVRQFIGQEVVAQMKEGKGVEMTSLVLRDIES